MSVALPIPLIQLLQVLTVAVGAPGVTGVIAKVEARLQGRRGPRVLQPYYDLAKLSRKEALAPEGASWFFLAAPLIAVTAYLTIPLLIPVLTSYPLPLGYMGDILGGGFLLSLASFVVATAALETGDPYAQLGSSRAKTFSAITEPVVLFVVFTVALLTGTDLPYALAATVRSTPWSGFGLVEGSVTLAGLPPTVGFVSEWFLLESLMQQFRVPGLGYRLVLALAGASVALTVGFAGVTFVRLVGLCCLGGNDPPQTPPALSPGGLIPPDPPWAGPPCSCSPYAAWRWRR